MKNNIIEELQISSKSLKNKNIGDLFEEDTNRAGKYQIKTDEILFDYSKQLITDEALKKLLLLTEAASLKENITNMRSGKHINFTEDRAVLHIALRDTHLPFAGSAQIQNDVSKFYRKMGDFADKVRNGQFKGCTGKSINTVVNIGIGGSDLGVEMACQALEYYASDELNFYFVSNVDPAQINHVLKKVNPESTLFIVCSKTFTTIETLKNAKTANDRMGSHFGKNYDASKHFCAITAVPEKAKQFGIHPDSIFPMWNWVGGRYSICACGLAVMIAIGQDLFEEFIQGFKKMDNHFFNTPFQKNIPVIMALLGIWHNNFLDAQSHAVIPYSSYLRRFSAYLQQADMESNGKNVNIHGENIVGETCPVIWGEPGTNAQHSIFQFLQQGTKIVPSDFIGFIQPLENAGNMHDILMSNFFAQQELLAFGKSYDELKAENQINELIPYKVMPGNRSVSCILFNKLTPGTLGSLIALYEHKIFVQGVIWEINSFDQWGVELGKVKATNILEEILNGKINKNLHDASTQNQIAHYLSVRNSSE